MVNMIKSTYDFENFAALVKYAPSEVMMSFQFPGREGIDTDGIIAGIAARVQNENPLFHFREELCLIKIPRRTIYVVRDPVAVAIDSTSRTNISRSLKEIYFTYERIKKEFPRFDAQSFENAFKKDYNYVFSNGNGHLAKTETERVSDEIDTLEQIISDEINNDGDFCHVTRLITKQRKLVERLPQQ